MISFLVLGYLDEFWCWDLLGGFDTAHAAARWVDMLDVLNEVHTLFHAFVKFS